MQRHLILSLLSWLAACGGDETRPRSAPVAASAPAAVSPPAALPSAEVMRGTPLAIRSGSVFACALREGGRVACWGTNTEGQLGQDHHDPIEGAVHVRGLEDAVALATSSATACALRRTGSVVCWGSNTGAGLGVVGERRGVGEVPGLRDMRGLDSDGGRFYAWGADGVVFAWGLADARVDEARSTGPRRTRLRDVVRIEGGRDRYALHPDGRATMWGFSGAGLEVLDDVVEVAGGSGGACLRNRAGEVRCALETGTGHEDRVAEPLRGAESIVFPRGGMVVGIREGTLQVFSYYPGSITRFEGADGLVSLGRGVSSSVMAITIDGGIRVWEGAARDGAYRPIEIALPGPEETAPEPPLPEGPMPPHCSVEVERIAAPAPMTLERAIIEALHEDGSEAFEPSELCLSMRTALGSSDCPTDGPWLGLGSVVGTVSAVLPLPDGRARLLSRVAADWSGTEEFDVLERWTLRSARPLALAMITSRGEPTDDDDPSPGEVARAAVVILEAPDGDFIEVRANVDLARMRRARALVTRLPTARLVDGRVELWACDGHGTYPIPSAASHAFDARPEDSAVIAGAAIPTSTTPAEPAAARSPAAPSSPPSAESIAAARAQCNEGFAALGRGELELARRDIDAALEVLARATDAATIRAHGACLYNRGRLAELDEDVPAARRFYERSLAVRPNATVEARMGALGP